MQVYKQKVKHLLYEQQNNIAELKAETLAELKVAQEAHNDSENTMWKEKRELKVQMKDQELAQQEVVRNLKKVCFIFALIIFTVFHLDRRRNNKFISRFIEINKSNFKQTTVRNIIIISK